jgi:hypothetical protein
MKIDRNDPGSLALRLQTVNQYILFVELANEKYISKSRSIRIGLTDPRP